jgi:hypothetical protein
VKEPRSARGAYRTYSWLTSNDRPTAPSRCRSVIFQVSVSNFILFADQKSLFIVVEASETQFVNLLLCYIHEVTQAGNSLEYRIQFAVISPNFGVQGVSSCSE